MVSTRISRVLVSLGRSVLPLRLPWSPARNAISASVLAWASGPLQPQLARDAFLNNSPAHPQLLARIFPSQASRPSRRERRKRFPPGDCNPKRSTAVFGTFRNPLTPALPGPAHWRCSGSRSEVRACLLQVGGGSASACVSGGTGFMHRGSLSRGH